MYVIIEVLCATLVFVLFMSYCHIKKYFKQCSRKYIPEFYGKCNNHLTKINPKYL